MTAPGRAVTRLAVRQSYRGALVVAVAAAGMSAMVASQFQAMFADALGGNAFAALTDNPAIRILFGPPVALDDPGGFTVWRTGTAIMVLVSVWALLTATRLTRGDEDAGRTDLLLAGRVTPTEVAARVLAVVSLSVAIVGLAVVLALVVSGTDPVGAVIYGACVAGAGVTFSAMGVVAAQVMPSRPTASGVAAATLAAALLARMLADGIGPLAWLAWLTPFGLAGKTAPYSANQTAPLLIMLVLAVALTVVALWAARRRDTGHGMLRIATSRPPRTRLLGSVIGFAVRRAIGPTTGWAMGIAAYFLLVGTLITSIIRFLSDNPLFAGLAATAGFASLGAATGFAAAMFSLLTIPVGLFAASRIATTTSDETTGRTTALLALPISRTRHASTEVVVTAVAVLVLLMAAALAFWLGATMTNAPLEVGAAFAGALNIAPVAWLSLGAAALAHGWAPQAVLAIGALPTAGGFLLQVIAQSIQAPSWVASISPYAHLAAVPSAPPDWAASLVLTGIAVLLAVLGAVGYARRDLKV